MQTIEQSAKKSKKMQWPTSLSSNRFMGFENSGMQPKDIAVCSHKMVLRLFPLIAPTFLKLKIIIRNENGDEMDLEVNTVGHVNGTAPPLGSPTDRGLFYTCSAQQTGCCW